MGRHLSGQLPETTWHECSAGGAFLRCILVAGFLAGFATATASHAVASPAPHGGEAGATTLERIGGLPLAFEENRGQCDPQVGFLARGGNFDALLSGRGAEVVLRGSGRARPSSIRIRFANGRGGTQPFGVGPLPGTANYLIGEDASQFVVDVGTFARVRYDSVYPGIGIVYYGNGGQLEYDLIVAPKADPGRIRMSIEGVDGIELTRDGSLLLRTPSGNVEMRRPVAYQDIRGERREVDARYFLAASGQVGFRVGAYDRRHTLVIDPIVALATNLWGNAKGVALDAAKNIYVIGTAYGSGLPTTGGYQTQMAGTQDAYVLKLNPTGTSVIYATYLGSRRAATSGYAIAVDSAGSAYVAGTTSATTGFPITPNAYRVSGSAFVAKLNPSGNALVYSTYVTAPVASLAVDAAGNTFMTGSTATLETTPGAFQSSANSSTSAYAAKLNAGGTGMSYATYLGGNGSDTGNGIAIDGAGNAYVVGVTRSTDFPTRNPLRASLGGAADAFVTKVNPSGTALLYSTYLGGSADERGFAIAVDAAGQAFVTGWTESTDFPRTAGVFQPAIGYPDPAISNAFVSKLTSSGDGLVYSSYLGGKWCLTATVRSCLSFFYPDEGIDVGTSIAVDAAGYAYLGGYATSTEFPLVDSMQTVDAKGDGWHVPLVARVAPAGDRLVYAAVLGTKGQDGTVGQVAVDGAGGVVVVGATPAGPFPLTPGTVVGSSNSFVFKLGNGRYPTIVQASANPVRRGQAVTLNATVLTPTPGGIVTFTDGANTLGSAVATAGTASLSVTLPPGVHRITATNSADGLVSPPHFQIVQGQ
jgi:hypothetical protein